MCYRLSLIVKVLLIITVLIITSRFHLRAQAELRAGFAVDIYDPSVNHFFDRYENVDRIRILYRNHQPDIIDIYYLNNKGPFSSERYRLSFDGDYYLLNKKYKNLPLPNDAKSSLTYLQGINKLNQLKTVYSRQTEIRRDSIRHHFTYYSYTSDTIPNLHRRSLQPTFKGDILKLTRDLENEFKTKKRIRPKDSIIILSGIVEKNGKIGPLSLIEGDNSDYTRTVLAFLSREATLWSPKRETSGTKRVSPVRISVLAKKDGTLKISIL